MKPTAKIDLDLFNSYVDRKLIARQEHPDGHLYIWNYTPVCQFGKNWDNVTLQARGLITDLEGNVIARPFRKFFNLEEHPGALPNEPFQVTEKLDGSLGIMYWNPTEHDYSIATRGSFISDQAVMGTKMLRWHLHQHSDDWMDPAYTYLFEIIYPSNRIVVNYGDAERLVLLAAINTETGDELDIRGIDYPDKAKLFDSPAALQQLRDAPIDNAEGYVVRFQSGLRIKMKFAEYVRLHRLLTQVSSKSIWELLKNGQDFSKLLDNVPDEFYDWVKDTAVTLSQNQQAIVGEANKAYGKIIDLGDRKAQALAMKGWSGTIRSIVFAMLDGKEMLTEEIAWKAVKPKYEQPFKQDIDG